MISLVVNRAWLAGVAVGLIALLATPVLLRMFARPPAELAMVSVWPGASWRLSSSQGESQVWTLKGGDNKTMAILEGGKIVCLYYPGVSLVVYKNGKAYMSASAGTVTAIPVVYFEGNGGAVYKFKVLESGEPQKVDSGGSQSPQ